MRPATLLCTVLALAGCSVGGDVAAQPAVSTVTVSAPMAIAPPSAGAEVPPSASTEATDAVPPSAPPVTSAPVAPIVEPPAAEPSMGDEPPVRYDAVSGSGCAPGADVLPAGWWYGILDGTPGWTVSFDLACYYAGAAGEQQAMIAGEPFWNDYFVVNDSPQHRTIPVASTATASCVYTAPRIADVECAPQQVSGDFAVWLRVDRGGVVTRIFEQFAP